MIANLFRKMLTWLGGLIVTESVKAISDWFAKKHQEGAGKGKLEQSLQDKIAKDGWTDMDLK